MSQNKKSSQGILDEIISGLISFDPDGKILISDALDLKDAEVLGLSKNARLKLHSKNKVYLEYHRKNIFKR